MPLINQPELAELVHWLKTVTCLSASVSSSLEEDGVFTLDSHYFSCLLFLFLPLTVLLRKLFVCFVFREYIYKYIVELCKLRMEINKRRFAKFMIIYAQIEFVTKIMTRKLAEVHLDKKFTIKIALSKQIKLYSHIELK